MLGDAVKAQRERLKLSQRELAHRAQIAQSYISKLEANQRPQPSWDVLKRLAAALEVQVADLLEAGGILSPTEEIAQSTNHPEEALARLQTIWPELPAADKELLLRMA